MSLRPVYRLGTLWESLRSSLWFVPGLLVLIGICLAASLIEAESYVDRERLVLEWPRLFGAGAEGARGMLSAIASSMITVAGVAFSITTVSFTLASSQYTSRILRTFMSDRGNQTVLGVFLGVFAYCLVVLRTIRGGDEGIFVPTLAVLGAFLLALLGIGFLVYFIHHVAASIQASSIIQSVANQTVRAIDRLYPDQAVGFNDGPALVDATALALPVKIPAHITGYVQALDRNSLLRIARDQNTVVRVERRVGEFVSEGVPLASVGLTSREPELVDRINAAFTVGRHRTMQQDAGYGIRQIVDIALKALSPGINDTTTATICLDYLGAILVRLGGRQLDPEDLRAEGEVRLLFSRKDYQDFLGDAFDQIRENAAGNTVVLTRLLEVLAVIAAHTRAERRRAVQSSGEAVVEMVNRTIASPYDRKLIERAIEQFATETAG
jgi:uncharacterized membrane protein